LLCKEDVVCLFLQPFSLSLATRCQANPARLRDFNLYDSDVALRATVSHYEGNRFERRLRFFGEKVGAATTIGWARAANAYPPQLNRFVCYGHQIDEVSFHFAFQDGSTRGLHPGLMFLNCQADRYDPFYAPAAQKTDLRLVWQ
jgi:hypothetical protein